MIHSNPFQKEKKQISIFITAGFPTLESTFEQVLSLQAQGVDFIELGIPFSDPMADGPVIQHTSTIALSNGMNLRVLFEMLSKHKDQISIPLVMMGYFNPILQFGLPHFLEHCKNHGVRHVIIPDISVELYEDQYKSLFDHYDVHVCFLITPETANERILKMAELSKNAFVYLVSQAAITGENKTISENLTKRYAEIKQLCGETPLMLGFGIKNKQDVETAHQFTDGAIIGTAYLKALEIGEEKEFVRGLVN
jgi:tryptophan synthase alpha chain